MNEKEDKRYDIGYKITEETTPRDLVDAKLVVSFGEARRIIQNHKNKIKWEREANESKKNCR